MYDNVNIRRGKKYHQDGSSVIKSVLEWNCIKMDELSISIPKKKQPILPEKIHQKLYGIPGQNIFTYDIDKPKPRRPFITQIDVVKLFNKYFKADMAPKEGSDNFTKCITRINIAFKDSLDKSLMPQESSEIKLIGRTILNRDHISHLKNDLLNNDDSNHLINPKIGASLIDVSTKISRRRQFKDKSENNLNASENVFTNSEDTTDGTAEH